MPNVFQNFNIFIQFPHISSNPCRDLKFLLLKMSEVVRKKRDNVYRALMISHHIRKEKVVRTNSKSLGLSTSIPSSG